MHSYQRSFRICGYIKTEHFLERQSERDIPDHLLRQFLKRKISHRRFYWIVVGKRLLNQLASRYDDKFHTQHNLIIIADGDKLVTCYFGKLLHREFPKNHQLIIIQNEETKH